MMRPPKRAVSPIQQRALNLIKIIDMMKTKESVTLADVCALINLSKSGARPYMFDLRDSEIITTVGMIPAEFRVPATIIYGLCGTEVQIAAFVERMNLAIMPKRKTKAPPALPKQAAWKIPAHDPLHAAFFRVATV